MDAETVGGTVIKPKLVEIFGATIADLLFTKAIFSGMQGSTEQESFQLIVESICSHPKVIGMWGTAQTEKQKFEWINAGSPDLG